MPIENRELKAGTVLKARHKGTEHSCDVVQTKDGLVYRTNGKDFNSPSSAGREITGGVAVNGWRFWSLDGDLKPRKAKSAPKAAKRAPAKKTAKKGKRAAKKAHSAKSGGSYGCGVCNATFATLKAATAHTAEHVAN